ncbi:MAG: pyrroloquinoline quinone biosynthesis protein PqqC [Nitrosopumilus sp. B06]|nr:MAG: pyrroloquinoline quinone biosynthesis protein PqqC [Nitrosopumilus sp. B06]
MDVINRIDGIIEEHSLLKHPFYQKWSEGKLECRSLAGYSKEYFQLVKAVPLFMVPIIRAAPESARCELEANMQEESDHILPWTDFAGELGVTGDELASCEGLEKTRKAVSELEILMNTYDAGASAMYALEKEIPKISQTKLDGLAEFYNITSQKATEYFKLHTEADIRHAASWRHILEQSRADPGDLINAAEKSVRAQNLLLDGCYEEYCS